MNFAYPILLRIVAHSLTLSDYSLIGVARFMALSFPILYIVWQSLHIVLGDWFCFELGFVPLTSTILNVLGWIVYPKSKSFQRRNNIVSTTGRNRSDDMSNSVMLW